jgi:membrane-bound inhibitor of C-type lysozyme
MLNEGGMNRRLARNGMAVVLTAALSGCGLADRLWSSGPTELSRVPEGAIAYRCDEGKPLLLRFDPANHSAWVLMPGREFRLDSVATGSGARYSNGRTTLSTRGEEASLEEDSVVTHAHCRKGAA